MIDDEPKAMDAGEKPDRSIRHGSYRIRRPGATISLNDNDSHRDDERTEIAVGSQTTDVGGPPGVLVQATFDNGGLLEAYTGLTMTPEQARVLSDRLSAAADAFENGEEGWFDR